MPLAAHSFILVSSLDLLDCLDLLLLNHFIPMLLCEGSSQEDGKQPLEPEDAEALQTVLPRLCQGEPHSLDAAQPIDRVEDEVLTPMSVFVDPSASGKDLIVKE